MRILIKHLHVTMRRGIIDVEIVLLHILPVIALVVGKPKEALFENRVIPVPQCQREAESSFLITDACEPVFPPPVRTGAGVIMRKIAPGLAPRAVILPNGAPLSVT